MTNLQQKQLDDTLEDLLLDGFKHDDKQYDSSDDLDISFTQAEAKANQMVKFNN